MDVPLEKRMDAMRQISEKKLLQILDQFSGFKDILIESALMKPLERFIGVKALRKHGVEKIFRFEPPAGNIPIINTHRVLLIYSEPMAVRQALQLVQSEQQMTTASGKPATHHLILVTGSFGFTAVSKLVEEEGLWGLVSLHQLTWEFLKLDDGLWSLELNTSLKSLMIQNDLTLAKSIARCLWSLQLVLGRPVLTWSQGAIASKVMGLIDTFKWPNESMRRGIDGSLGCLAVISRDVDWPAALLTPVTYTALLNQVIGINCGHVKLPSTEANAVNTIELKKSEHIYQHIHNLHFSSVFPYLREQSKSLLAEANKSRDLTTAQMKEFVKEKLGKAAAVKKELAQHIDACEAVVEQIGASFENIHTAESFALRGRKGGLQYIEDLLGQGQLSVSQSLRLLALLSLGGLQDEANTMKGQFLLTHGHKYLSTFECMDKAGLLNEPETLVGSSLVGRVTLAVNRKDSSLQTVAKKFKLFPPEDGHPPNPHLPAQDMSYVFGGNYIPVICRMIEWLIKGEPIAQMEEALKFLPGPTKWYNREGKSVQRLPSVPVNPKTFFVFVIGGLTYAEYAAFQILEALTGAKIMVAGTSMLTKDSFENALC